MSRPSPVMLLALTVLLYGLSAHAADNALLGQRLEALEARVAELERQLRESRMGNRWKDPRLWQRIHRGMDGAAIRELLGPPERKEQRVFDTWYYHPTSKRHSYVWFDEGAVLGWSGPEP